LILSSISVVSIQVVALISFICSLIDKFQSFNGSIVNEFNNSSRLACEIFSPFKLASSVEFQAGFFAVHFEKVLSIISSCSSHFISIFIVALFSHILTSELGETFQVQ